MIEIEIENLAEINQVQNDCNEIVHKEAEKLSYNQFFHEFMNKNVPIVIKNVNILTEFTKQWIDKSDTINIDEMHKSLENEIVPVYNCSKKYFNSHEKFSMTFNEYCDYWKSKRENLKYLKDFHLKHQRPDLDFYNVPKYFASDWLNEYLIDKGKDDYRFVYLGTKSTYTPLHSDVFGSFSWSVNVSGKKRWIFLKPNEENKLKDSLNQLPFSVEEDELKEKNVDYFVLIQEPNDSIFVPSQWFHQVENLTDVLSINHNWFNGCNIEIIYNNLLKNYEDVKQEIADCSDMENFEEHCQIMLKSLFGINFEDFIDILIHIGQKRIELIRNKEKQQIFDKFSLGQNHTNFDLNAIAKILEKISKLKKINDIEKTKIYEIILKIKKNAHDHT
ncbi:hypothetical protein PVAND_005088 [Polypedilum vanderplanki]|uniref:Jumonji domain-containing protein 4 n=1 Tax=Polypedilum vanderplanki TaxID=319348 RepID=A0A9J6BZI6_POLVA|nr:hypothetical protein PVAND_005088 [Polypedilum vanderplanki]